MTSVAYRAVIFDLFDTLVQFDSAVPRVNVAGTERRTTMSWLRPRFDEELPGASFDEFLAAMAAVTEEIVRGRPPEYFEIPSEERFRRALTRMGAAVDDPAPVARKLSAAHMQYLASCTALPPENRSLLQSLRGKVRIGLVSNFDHGPTAHSVLARDGIAEFLDATVISADFGRRKPHPLIFREGLRLLDVASRDSLYVGDTLADDVEGALGAGMDVAWLDAKGRGVGEGRVKPTYHIGNLTEVLPLVLGA